MKKAYKLSELDCANCAAKMEDLISKIDGVKGCRIGFMTQKMTLDVEDGRLDEILPEVEKAIKTIDKNTDIIKR